MNQASKNKMLTVFSVCFFPMHMTDGKVFIPIYLVGKVLTNTNSWVHEESRLYESV